MYSIATTENGALQYHIDDVVEFFTQVGANAPIDALYDLFRKAVHENKDLAIRSLLWSYDCRGGAGRRSNFLNILPKAIDDGLITEYEAKSLITRIPEFGRWDAVYKIAEAAKNRNIQSFALNMICDGLLNGDALCAKWMPRKGLMAARIRGYFNKVLGKPMTPKQWRKLLVENTKVVETLMSANKWSEIDYEHVPSVAGARYRNAFDRHDGKRHQEYIEAVANGEAKMNTSTLYPHDIVRMLGGRVDPNIVNTSWRELQDIPDILGNVLCMTDVSGSMTDRISGSVSALNVAITMAIYFAERSEGLWRNKVMTYSGTPAILELGEDEPFDQKYTTIKYGSPDPFNTDIRAAYRKIIKFGKDNNIPNEQMPKALIILSDMQFDSIGPQTIGDNIKQSFEEAGYDVPRLIYWNLNSYCNGVPIGNILSPDAVQYSGYSPRGIETVLGTRTMMDVLLDTVNVERYKWN